MSLSNEISATGMSFVFSYNSFLGKCSKTLNCSFSKSLIESNSSPAPKNSNFQFTSLIELNVLINSLIFCGFPILPAYKIIFLSSFGFSLDIS